MAEETRLSIVAQLRAEGFTQGVRKMQRQLNGVSRTAKQTGASLTKAITGPVLVAFGAAANAAIGFEKAMAGVKAVSGFAATDIERLSDSARDLGKNTQLTANEAAGLQAELAKLGFSADEILKLQGSVANLSIAFGVDLAEAAERTGNILRIFGKDATDAALVTDQLAVAFGSSALDSASLSEALVKVGPIANSAGVEFEDVVSALALLANNGVKGSVAGVALAKTLSTLAQEGGDVSKKFKEVVNGTISVSDGIDRFGERAGKFLPILSESGEELGAFREGLDDAAGASDKARAAIEDTADGALRKLGSALTEAGIALGEVLLPFIKSLATSLTAIVNKFSSLSPAAKTAITVVAALAAAIGPLLLVIGSLTASMSSLIGTAALLGTTVTGILGPIGLLAGAIVGVGMLAFASATREANAELRKQGQLARDIAKATKDESFNRDKNVDELQELIDLTEETGVIGQETLRNLAAQGNQYANIGGLYAQVRKEAGGFNADTEVLIGLLEEEKEVQEQLAEEARIAAEEKKRAAALAAASTESAKDELATRLALQAIKIDESNFVDFSKIKDDSVDLVDNLLRVDNIVRSLQGIELDAVTLDDEKGIDEDPIPLDFGNKFAILKQQSATAAKDFKDGFLLSIGAVKDGLLDAFNEDNIAGTITFLTGAFTSVFDAILDGSQSVGEVLKSIFLDLVKGALATALANAIASAFSPLSPDNIATGGAAAPAKAATLTSTIAGLFGAIPAFAEGGAVTSATLALVGEKPGSRGEAIIPFEKMGQFIGQVMPEGVGTNVVVTGRISGNDIAISNRRGSGARGRSF